MIVYLAVRLLVRWRRDVLRIHAHGHEDREHLHPDELRGGSRLRLPPV
jgi:hypothetical protein